MYWVPIGEIWRVSQTLTPLWLSSLTLWQIRYLHSHFVDVAVEPQRLRDLFKKPQFVVRLGVRGSWPWIFSASFCLSCSLCPDAFSPCYRCSVVKSCLTLCDPMDCGMPGLPVHHQLLKFTQTHVRWVGDAIQPLLFPINLGISDSFLFRFQFPPQVTSPSDQPVSHFPVYFLHSTS